MAGWTTLVQAETLAVALNRPDLAIVDCRFTLINSLAGESAYLDGHIPGAVYAHLERDLSDMTPGGEGRHPWPRRRSSPRSSVRGASHRTTRSSRTTTAMARTRRASGS
jgi:3-mercaptopyruvate sulfurtransferase SseA